MQTRLTRPIFCLSKALAAGTLSLLLSLPSESQDLHPISFHLDFGPGVVTPGHIQVLPDMIYSKERGYGFEPGASLKSAGQDDGLHLRSSIVSEQPFQFSVALPEGNYQVVVTLGDPSSESKTTIKAEIRRLVVEKAHLSIGKFETRLFNVNIRTPQILGGGEVKLKDREKESEARAWDERLTLEFGDDRPCIAAIEIRKVENLPIVYLCGDSTVCDQPGEA